MFTIYDIYEGIMDRGNRQTVGNDLSIYRELEQFKTNRIPKAPYALDVDGERDDRKERTDFLFIAECPNLLSMNGLDVVNGPCKLELRSKMEKYRGGWPVQIHYSHELVVRLLDKNNKPCSADVQVHMDTWTTQKDCKTDLIRLINTIGKSQEKFNEFIKLCWDGAYHKYNYVTGTFNYTRK